MYKCSKNHFSYLKWKKSKINIKKKEGSIGLHKIDHADYQVRLYNCRIVEFV